MLKHGMKHLIESPFQAHAAARGRACLSAKRTFQLTIKINKLSSLLAPFFILLQVYVFTSLIKSTTIK